MARVPAAAVLAGVLAGVLVALSALPLARARPETADNDRCSGDGDGGGDDSIAESIRKIIREGSEELGLPVLDPLQVDVLNASFDEPRSYDVSGLLRELVAKGLGDFEMTMNRSYNILPPSVDVTVKVIVPLIQAEGGYAFDALLGEVVHLYGDGNFQLKLPELEVTISGRVVSLLIFSQLTRLSTSINVKDIEFELDGLLEGGLVDDIFNLAVNEVAKVIFIDQKSALENYLAGLLFDPINNVVSGIGFQEILCLLCIRCSS